MNPDHRASLEAIATSNDPSVKPADRLRAIELLQEADPQHGDPAFEAAVENARYVASLSDDELDRELAQYLGGEQDRMERRARELARELADPDRIEAEIERRADERAAELYRSRAFSAVENVNTEKAEEDTERANGHAERAAESVSEDAAESRPRRFKPGGLPESRRPRSLL